MASSVPWLLRWNMSFQSECLIARFFANPRRRLLVGIMLAPNPAEKSRTLIDTVFLIFVFLIPLFPRPTAMGPERWIVPLVMSALIGLWLVCRPSIKKIRGGNFQLLVLVLLFPLITFCIRSVVQGGLADEALQFVSRILFAIGLFVMTHWLCTTQVPRKTVFKMFFYGFLATSVLTIFCGVTGIQILEEDSVKPSRFLGLQKSTGIFRSFGEFGIMAGIAWSYLLMYRREHHVLTCLIGGAMIFLAMLIAQSRNVYLVFILVSVLLVMFKNFRLPVFFRVSLASLMILIPFAMEMTVPLLQTTNFGNQLIGTGSILERNVDIRFEQIEEAGKMISQDPGGAIVGFPRSDWRDLMMESRGAVVAPHNHFVSNVLFLGIAGGTVWILGLFIIPGISLSQRIQGDRECQLAMATFLGCIIGLSFYEGFFSVVVMFSLAMAWTCAYSAKYQPVFQKQTSETTSDDSQEVDEVAVTKPLRSWQ